MSEKKSCKVCEESKEKSEFYSRKAKNGRRWDSTCKDCRKSKQGERYRNLDETEKEELLEKVRKRGKTYRESGRESEVKKIWRESNKDKVNEYQRRWRGSDNGKAQRQRHYEENKEELLKKNMDRHYKNREDPIWVEKQNALARERMRRYALDPVWKLAQGVRRDVGMAIKRSNGVKGGRTFEALPYTPQQLKEHLESQFQEGMTWDNHGEWHIDHIIPQAALRYDSLEHPNFLKCWALDNLQPLWAKENLRKGSLHEGKRHYYQS